MTEHNYQVFLPATIARGRSSFAVRLGENSDDIVTLYASHNAKSCAFISAYNPAGSPCDPISNLKQQSALFGFLADSGLTWFDGAAVAEPGQFEQTPCALVLGIELADAHFAARQFGQRSFVYADERAVPELVRTTGTVPSLSHDDELALLGGTISSGDFGSARDLHALARMYGVEAATTGGLIRLITAMTGSRGLRHDLVPTVFSSTWQRLGEQLEHVYAEHPDELMLEVGHHSTDEGSDQGRFHVAASFSLGDVRRRFERRRAPRTTEFKSPLEE
jgi:hypothetical protein